MGKSGGPGLQILPSAAALNAGMPDLTRRPLEFNA